MYLDRILGSKVKINILAALVAKPEASFVEKDLAIECGVSLSETNRQIKDLVNSGIVKMQRIGKSKVYQINKEHFLFATLQKLFKDLSYVYREIAEELVKFVKGKYKLKAAILMGSLVKSAVREDIVEEPSDIDIIFVTDEKARIKKDLISYINSEISTKYGIVVYPIVLSAEEYMRGLKDYPLIIEAHAKGELLYGEKPRRFS